ncbi:alpha/beta-type small acid-soluble spore protein [Calderihabitans maritimus]|uniref:Alpha/beta type small acid-soluble spore protein n=1 Tax=Calderihabitans maritimus TaxID=1246530 RepID=A0A1Z5HPP2_9FIRM|nr:alpha/beta-type small acid-soluble spore protein [Calderihabitans maritimus]GAW91408.1 alpha/beta type small acid-soluble spore protein [Calderihabitans maritimus]
MGAGQKRNQILVPEARRAMEQFKYEAATEVGLNVKEGDYWGNLTSRDCGAVGGAMVRRMIQAYEQSLAQQQQPR